MAYRRSGELTLRECFCAVQCGVYCLAETFTCAMGRRDRENCKLGEKRCAHSSLLPSYRGALTAAACITIARSSLNLPFRTRCSLGFSWRYIFFPFFWGRSRPDPLISIAQNWHIDYDCKLIGPNCCGTVRVGALLGRRTVACTFLHTYSCINYRRTSTICKIVPKASKTEVLFTQIMVFLLWL